jgi:hypothetical protein
LFILYNLFKHKEGLMTTEVLLVWAVEFAILRIFGIQMVPWNEILCMALGPTVLVVSVYWVYGKWTDKRLYEAWKRNLKSA